MVNIGLMVGTGSKHLVKDKDIVETSEGDVEFGRLDIGNKLVVAVDRHQGLRGPHLANYRAIALAFRNLSVDLVFSASATGRISPDVHPGHFGCCSEIFNYNFNTADVSFMQPGLIIHTGEPYFTPDLQGLVVKAWDVVKDEISDIYSSSGLTAQFHPNALYACIEGPQFLPKCEEDVLRYNLSRAGYPTQVFIGMTAREAFAFKELGLDYALLSICTDYSSSPPDKGSTVNHSGVKDVMQITGRAAFAILSAAISLIPDSYVRQSRIYVNKDDVNISFLSGNGKDDLVSAICKDMGWP